MELCTTRVTVAGSEIPDLVVEDLTVEDLMVEEDSFKNCYAQDKVVWKVEWFMNWDFFCKVLC